MGPSLMMTTSFFWAARDINGRNSDETLCTDTALTSSVSMHVFDAVLFEDLDAGIIHDNVEPLSGTEFFLATSWTAAAMESSFITS